MQIITPTIWFGRCLAVKSFGNLCEAHFRLCVDWQAIESCDIHLFNYPFTLSAINPCSFKVQVMDENSGILYSPVYCDDYYEYRHVRLPTRLEKLFPKNVLYTESEWRSIGVTMSTGWQHHAIHNPEPHILLFRRSLNKLQRWYLKPNAGHYFDVFWFVKRYLMIAFENNYWLSHLKTLVWKPESPKKRSMITLIATVVMSIKENVWSLKK